MAAVTKLDQDFQAFWGWRCRVVARIGFVCLLEAGKNPDRLLHKDIISRGWPGKIILVTGCFRLNRRCMSEMTCANCGAPARLDLERGLIVCDYCGTEAVPAIGEDGVQV